VLETKEIRTVRGSVNPSKAHLTTFLTRATTLTFMERRSPRIINLMGTEIMLSTHRIQIRLTNQ